jgi:transposase
MKIPKKEKSLKKIQEIKVNDSRVLVYQDEVHFQIQTTVTAGWFKKGSKPKVKSFPGRFKVSYSGFIIPQSGELFVSKPSTFNYETTIAAIREFHVAHPIAEGKKYAIVMDNAPWHKKAMRFIATEKLEEYSDIDEKVEFVKLPPYSPDFNPIEQVWRITRKENTHNVFFRDLKTLQDTVDNAFKVWAKPNAQLASLCSF